MNRRDLLGLGAISVLLGPKIEMGEAKATDDGQLAVNLTVVSPGACAFLKIDQSLPSKVIENLRSEWAEAVKGSCLEGKKLVVLPVGSSLEIVQEGQSCP